MYKTNKSTAAQSADFDMRLNSEPRAQNHHAKLTSVFNKINTRLKYYYYFSEQRLYNLSPCNSLKIPNFLVTRNFFLIFLSPRRQR